MSHGWRVKIKLCASIFTVDSHTNEDAWGAFYFECGLLCMQSVVPLLLLFVCCYHDNYGNKAKEADPVAVANNTYCHWLENAIHIISLRGSILACTRLTLSLRKKPNKS